MIDARFFESAVREMKAKVADGRSGDVEVSICVDGRVPGIAIEKLDTFQFLKTDKSIPEDVNIGIKGKEVRHLMEISPALRIGARPILSPRNAYSKLRGKVVLIVAIDE